MFQTIRSIKGLRPWGVIKIRLTKDMRMTSGYFVQVYATNPDNDKSFVIQNQARGYSS